MSNIRNKNISDHDSTELESYENQLCSHDKDMIDLMRQVVKELKKMNLQLSFITDEEGE